MTLIWTLEVNTNYVAHELQGIPFPFEPIFARGRKFLSRERCREEGSQRESVFYKRAWRTAQRRLQQVHSAVVEEVGCAVRSGLHHLVLADHLDRLVIDAQPAVQPDLEDVCSVMTTRRTAAVMLSLIHI